VIDVDGVHLALGETDVLSGVDCSVTEGEFVGLVGPNGTGKTTLLRTINGLLDPDAGTVRVDGDDVAALGSKALSRRVATVPQTTSLEFAFTVEQVVEMGRTPHRSRLDWTDATAAVERALARTETSHLAERHVDEISGGERQRVLLARALAQEAPVLVLDEPTASLDVNHQVRVLELVRELVDDGRTVVAAIHDLDLAARYCDRLALLYDGRIVAADAPETVLSPSNLADAFGTTVGVTESELTGSPQVTAVADRPERDARVHVVGGGRPGARALGACWRAGFDVSVGVVPTGDVAATLADDLDATAITAAPFAAVDRATREAVHDRLVAADVVVLARDDPDPAAAAALEECERVVDWRAGVEDDAVADLHRSPAGGAGAEPGAPAADAAVVDAVLDELPGATGDD